MQIQRISNNYQTQRAQKQNNPSFGATIKPAEGVLASVRNDLAQLIEKNRKNFFLENAMNVLTETMKNLISHNNNPASHQIYDASCTIPIKQIDFRTEGEAWLDSSNPIAIKNWLPSFDIEDLQNSYLRIKTNNRITSIPLDSNPEDLAKTATEIQEAAIGAFEGQNPFGALCKYDLALTHTGKVKDIEL